MSNNTTNHQQAADDLEQAMLKVTVYSGNRDKGKRILSASSLANEDLQIYLDFKHGKQPDTVFGANSLGSMLHLGLEHGLSTNDQYSTEQRYEMPIPGTDWVLSGEIDLLDHKNKVIIDHKLSTSTALKKVKSEGPMHQYAIQLAVYKALVKHNTGKEYTGALSFFNKSASYFKNVPEDIFNYVEVETIGYNEVMEMAVAKVKVIEQYLSTDTEPPRCDNLFWHKRKGKSIPMRCLYYCNFNRSCIHYKEYQTENVFLDKLTDEDNKGLAKLGL